MRNWLILFIFLLVSPLSGHAQSQYSHLNTPLEAEVGRPLQLPDWFLNMIPKKLRPKLFKKLLNDIKIETPESMLERMQLATGDSSELSYGYNGVAFKTDELVTKLNIHAFCDRDWQQKVLRPSSTSWYQLLPLLSPGAIERRNELLGWGGDTSASLYKEILGALIWKTYNPKDTTRLIVSTDFQGFQRAFVPGVTLRQVLADSDTPYNMQAIWKQFVVLQNTAENILKDTGLTIDLISAANLLVSGEYDRPVLTPIDFELMVPSAETYQYYEARNTKLPLTGQPLNLQWVRWPLMPENILIQNLWNLNFNQAIDYIKARFNITNTEAAIRKLATIPKFPIPFFDFAQNYNNIDEAIKRTTTGKCDGYIF
ncbi:MAG: hypothetical protein JNM93_00850 [Bacteriovoracaceae bacterium]|nr:hypothetical protein [Bacteriovoracaceae bacterium]